MAKIVLINNVYSYRNRGDSAIVESIAHAIQKDCAEAQIYLMSQYHEDNSSYYEQFGWHSVPMYWDIPMNDNKVIRLLLAIKALFLIVLKWLDSFFGEDRDNTQWLYRHADLIIDAGGGSFYSSNKYRIYLGFYQHLVNLYAGVFHGCKVIVAPQSMGPIYRGYEMKCLCYVLNRVDRVYVRELKSYEMLKENGVSSTLTQDCAFLNNYKFEAVAKFLEPIEESDGLKVGVTVLDWGWASPLGIDAKEGVKEYLKKLASGIREYAGGREVTVFLYSHADVEFTHSDYAVSQNAQKYFTEVGVKSVVMDPDMSASDLLHAYSAMDVFVGSRMHSVILTLLENTPCVALSYQPKTFGVMKMLGLEDYSLDVYSFSEKDIIEKLNIIDKEGGELRERILKRVSAVSLEISEVFESIVREYLKAK